MALEVVAGDVLGGKFRVERVVGRGGMGIVLEATNTQLDQKVALKLLARGADDPNVVERFTHEAKAAARLRSEHVARVYDVGKDPVHGPFIVMEMLVGQTLASLLEKTGRVPVHRAVEYAIDACEGLAEAHARGIVHRDVKPANLFLVTGDDGTPAVKVLDFGIASMDRDQPSAAQDARSSAPRSQGTPAYLSPEQLRSGVTIDHRADVWALGCVIYELLANQKAFRSTRFTELVTKILEAPPDPFPTDVDVPGPLLAVVLRCLEKDPAKRFNSTGELALALLPFARRRAHSSVSRAVAHVKTGGIDPGLEMPSSMPPPPPDDSAPNVAASVMPNLRAPSVPSFPEGVAVVPPPAPKSRLPLAIALLFGVVALGGAGFAVVMRSGQAVVTAPTTPPVTASSASQPPPLPSPPPAPPPTPSATPAVEPPPSPAAPAPLAVPTPRPVLKPRPTGPTPAGSEAEIRRER